MSDNRLHIISFDVPYPPNYGGIIDVFYKLKYLSEADVKIKLHCFRYADHNPPNDELNKYCEEVFYYERKRSFWTAVFSKLPFIVQSRNNKELLENLIQDEDPILFEGLHTCYFLNHPSLQERLKLVRAHNVEHDYYRGLAKWEKKPTKKKFFIKEAKRLEAFESELAGADAILSIARKDVEHFDKYTKTHHLPPFHKVESVKEKINKSGIEGNYILFQGNLSVQENEESVRFILEEIVPKLEYKFVFAGKDPSEWLKNEIKVTDNVQLIDSPPSVTMESLIQHAHINLLLASQQTGVKLKLLHALQSGRHIIINSLMDDDGIFKDLCHIIDEPDKIISKINELMSIEMTEAELQIRQKKFQETFDNKRNAEKIVEILNS